MTPLIKTLQVLFFMLFAMAAAAADNPYSETADARLEIKQATAGNLLSMKPNGLFCQTRSE